MNGIEQVTHLEAMQGRVPSHMRPALGFGSLLSVSAAQYQALETALIAMLTERALDAAVGAQLDGIGDVLDLGRTLGQADDEYRFALRTHVLTLAKSGDPEAVIEAYINVTVAPAADYVELYPATFQISVIPTVDVGDPLISAFIAATMQGAKPAGVNMILLTSVGFGFAQDSETDIDNNGPISATEGFGSSVGGETDGGELSKVVV